ncbi:hypothetical protein H2Y57_22335 [Pectobacterium aroidearum]|uniref:Uncharacterized protein n=1 Tax=Pectobacterium aroidearum TaxID=1201031 RepID=A0AAW3T2I4_9GAMM|nr:hypothetical protein [Pectobacterium aroidearum]MBA5206417.1 hypothetical protein [Pectobacterium aroidearum]
MMEDDLAEMVLGNYEQQKNHPHKNNERQSLPKKGLVRSLMYRLSIQDTPRISIDYAFFSLAINTCISE